MAYTNLAPRTRNITGADLTGIDGATNRTYTIPDVGVFSSGLDFTINGTQLHNGPALDFTLSGETITFLNNVDDTDVIALNYFIALTSGTISSLVTSAALRYSTPLQFAAILGISANIPSWDVSGTPSREEVGTGNDVQTIFYLDHQNIISDTYTILYGATDAAATELTETTHYTLDKTKGKITLTSAGVTLVTTNKIYAEYSYLTNGMSDDFLVTTLQRAEQELDNAVNTTFIDSSTENPSFSISDERHSSKGYFEQQYFTKKRNPLDITCELSADITDSDVTISLDTACGILFPSSGYILIGSEIISYTGVSSDDLTGCTRGALGSTAAAHSEDDEVHTSIMQVSGTAQGSAPTWNTLQYKSDFVIDDRKFFIYDNVVEGVGLSTNNLLATPDVENRVRIIYLYGNDSIPVDITRLTLLYAKRQLITDNIGKAMIAGRNEFRPEMLNADMEEIERIKNTYIELPMGNT